MNKVLTATVKKTGEKIQVYKLEDGRYQIFLGDKLSISAIEKKEHERIFKKEELNL